MTAEPESTADPAPVSREFDVDGATWVAEVTGQGAVGGTLGFVAIESVYFRRRGESDPQIRLAYLPRGSFTILGDDELRAVQRSAPPLAPRPAPDSGTAR